MIRDYYFLARRGEEQNPPQIQVLHASMGSLHLVTPGRAIGGLRRAGSAISWIVFILIFTILPVLFGFVLADPVATALIIVGVGAFGVLLGFLIPRAVVRYAVRHPQKTETVSVADVQLRRWFHDVTVRDNGGEFLLKVQGRRRSLADALTMTGHPVAPWS